MPLELAFREYFIVYLMEGRIDEFIDCLCNCITWVVKRAGIGISYPTHTAPDKFEMSEHCCEVLTASLINR